MNPKYLDYLYQLISFVISLIIFCLLAGTVKLWEVDGTEVFSSFFSSACILGPALILLLAATYKLAGKNAVLELKLSPIGFAYGLIFYFISDFCCRGFTLFQGPSIRGELFAIWLLLLACWQFISDKFLKYFLITAVIALVGSFFYLSGGQPISSDDHPSFIFRLSLLKQYFPNVPIYYPAWNAGLDARDFFATGALGYFLLTFPLHYLLNIELSHNIALVFVLFALLPASIAYACNLLGLNKSCSYIAAILSLTSSLVWYKWALKYGTVGFVTSASLMPAIFALGFKLLSEHSLSKFQFLIFIFLGSISIMWPLGSSCYLALVLFALFKAKTCITNKKILATALILIIINLPWAVTLWKVSAVSKFVNTTSSTFSEHTYRHKQKGLNIENSLKVLREAANSVNPLIIFLALPGIFLLPKNLRIIFSLQSAIFFIAGSVLVSVKPQLELDRMLVFLSIFLCIPVAVTLNYLYENSSSNRAICTFSFSFLMLSPFITSNIIHNRSAENYNFASGDTNKLIDFIRNSETTGRLLFSGFVLHELDGGHVAPLPEWTKKPFIASSPFHNRWTYTSVFPESFAKQGSQGIQQFLDLYNVEIILAHEKIWKDHFMMQPELYEISATIKPFKIFKRKRFISNYFIEGTGQVISQNGNELILKVSSTESIVKFNYYPFLTSTNCKISPYKIDSDLPFIRLSDCRINEQVIIKSVPVYQRVLQ